MCDQKHRASLTGTVLRDVRERGRDIEGCIKQWFSFVKPNFHKYVEPQRIVADLIVPRGIENLVAIDMVTDSIKKTLQTRSEAHQLQLEELDQVAEETPLNDHAVIIDQKPQIKGIHTLLLDSHLPREDFIFYFDRVAALLIERYTPPTLATTTSPS